MIKKVLLLFGLILIVTLFGGENDLEEAKILINSGEFFIIKFSPGLLYGATIGYGKQHIINETRVESILNLHYNEGRIIQGFKVGGLYYRYNFFLNKNRGGLFGLLNLGIDFAVIGEGDEKIVPNISFGSGYSFRVNPKLFLRIELDIGMKLYLTNLNFAIIF